jgi:expansin (peptidoglycan-binding protein)
MALNDTDRRRIIAVTVLTLVALPALWWANTSENSSTSPNLAVAGIDPNVEAPTAAPTPAATDDGLDDVAPVFLEGPASAAGAGQSEIAVPAKPLIDGVIATATFRSSVADGTCIVAGVTSGSKVTVVNLENNRSVSCTTLLAPGNRPGDLVMSTNAFAGIADLTDAPIPVEIHR